MKITEYREMFGLDLDATTTKFLEVGVDSVAG
jgi:hypothetical protein